MQSSLCLGKRPYSILSDEIALSRLPNIDPSKLQVTKTKSPKDLVPSEQLIFGRNFTGWEADDQTMSLSVAHHSLLNRPYAVH